MIVMQGTLLLSLPPLLPFRGRGFVSGDTLAGRIIFYRSSYSCVRHQSICTGRPLLQVSVTVT